MTDRPILFSAPMVRALLDGRKTQTRRISKGANDFGLTYVVALDDAPGWFGDEEGDVCFSAGYKPGDRLYVREEYYQRGSWAPVEGAVTKGGKQKWAFVPADDRIQFHPQGSFRRAREASDPKTVWLHKRLGRFMPRAASRLTLTVTDVRVERLQACSEADAIAEGIEVGKHPDTGEAGGWKSYETIHSGRHRGKRHPHAILPNISPVTSYAELWDSINGEGAWAANPWVVAVSFDVWKGNIDAVQHDGAQTMEAAHG